MSEANERDEMLPEYDLDALGPPQRGRYYERYVSTFAIRELAPDLAPEFKDSESVNEALREYLRMKRESA